MYNCLLPASICDYHAICSGIHSYANGDPNAQVNSHIDADCYASAATTISDF